MVSLFSIANEMNEEEKNLYIHVNNLCSLNQGVKEFTPCLNLALVFKMYVYMK